MGSSRKWKTKNKAKNKTKYKTKQNKKLGKCHKKRLLQFSHCELSIYK